jgi:hypothetical protein
MLEKCCLERCVLFIADIINEDDKYRRHGVVGFLVTII